MLIEKNVLANSVFSFIEDGCLPISNDKEKLSFKSYLKKDENNCYTIIDKDHSIKCLFDKNYLKDYMGAQPSYFKVDNFDGSLILIKKSYFDVCFYKNVNKTISVRVVLFIQEFELDIAQKIQKEGSLTVRKNVNSNPKIAQRLNIFFYKHIKEVIIIL